MKALTIYQPYAHLIVIGDKLVENRRYAIRHRGALAIHAGKGRHWLLPHDEVHYPDMAFGAIVGVADISDCVRIVTLRRMMKYVHLHDHIHTEGPFCWILTNVRRLVDPIPWRGERGVFDVPDDVFAGGSFAPAGLRADG